MDLLTEIQTELKKGKIVKTKKKPKKVSLQPVYNTLILTGLTIATIGIATLSIKAYNWKQTHEFINPITWNGFVREIKVEEKAIEYPNKPVFDTPIEEYICSKFGIMDCKLALAVFKAESNMDCNAWNVNDNRTWDGGIAQINSIHFDDKFTPADIFDCYKNIDKAYELWEESDGVVGDGKGLFIKWSAFNNGSFGKFYE